MQVDLSGGYYDAGDNVKFGLPMAFSIAMLAWDVVEFRQSLTQTRQLGNTLNALRWGTDYLLKANTGPTVLWVQVSIAFFSLPLPSLQGLVCGSSNDILKYSL